MNLHDIFDNLLNTPRIKIRKDPADEQIPTNNPSENQAKTYITSNDVVTAIKPLHTKKSSDLFSIKAEHFLFAISCNQLITYLTNLYNQIIQTGIVLELNITYYSSR